jgi:hypothetical protein
MTTNNHKPELPLSDHEKQRTPLEDEVSPKVARAKAIVFATQAKTRMVPKKR